MFSRAFPVLIGQQKKMAAREPLPLCDSDKKKKAGGACRVKRCRSHGKIFLDLYRHVRIQHPHIRWTDHMKLPVPNDSIILEANNRPYMKYRREEFCKVDACYQKKCVFKDLTRHLKTVHQLTRKEYESKYPKVEGTFIKGKYDVDHMSVILPGEKDVFDKLEINGEFPEVPARCPISVEPFGDITVQDEEKYWFVNKWLDGYERFIEDDAKFDFIRRWISGKEKFIPESEYPKRRIFDFEVEPSMMYAARSFTQMYERERDGFDVRKRLRIMKTLVSAEEEFYFQRAIRTCEIFFCRAKLGMFEFDCKFCDKFHEAVFLHEFIYENNN